MADGPPSIPGIPTDPSVAEVLGTCADAQVPCGPVYAIDEIFDDPQYAARGNIAMVPTRIADMANVMPRLTGTPGAIDWAGKPLTRRSNGHVLAAGDAKVHAEACRVLAGG